MIIKPLFLLLGFAYQLLSDNSFEKYLNSDGFFSRDRYEQDRRGDDLPPVDSFYYNQRESREGKIKFLEKEYLKEYFPIRLRREGDEDDEVEEIDSDDKFYNRYYKDRRAGRISDRSWYRSKAGKGRKSFEVGFQVSAENSLFVSNTFPSFSIERDIEFYHKFLYSPYFRFYFDDIELSIKSPYVFRNSFELNYRNFYQQVPKFSSNGSFYLDGAINLGTAIDIYSLLWRGSLLYRYSSLSFGGYFGLGGSMITGSLYPFYFIDHSEISEDNYYRFYSLNGMIVTIYDPVVVSEFGFQGDYGLTFNLDFKYVHFGLSLHHSISKQLGLHWIRKLFLIELGFKF
jgi:hypothetical protein